MRGVNIILVVLAIVGSATNSFAAGRMRLTQTSTTTNCLMGCNAQYAMCQSSCLVPGTPPTGAATAGSNATASTSCLLNCSTAQLSCHTICAQTSPSQ
jgi:hypothetical protein